MTRVSQLIEYTQKPEINTTEEPQKLSQGLIVALVVGVAFVFVIISITIVVLLKLKKSNAPKLGSVRMISSSNSKFFTIIDDNMVDQVFSAVNQQANDSSLSDCFISPRSYSEKKYLNFDIGKLVNPCIDVINLNLVDDGNRENSMKNDQLGMKFSQRSTICHTTFPTPNNIFDLTPTSSINSKTSVETSEYMTSDINDISSSISSINSQYQASANDQESIKKKLEPTNSNPFYADTYNDDTNLSSISYDIPCNLEQSILTDCALTTDDASEELNQISRDISNHSLDDPPIHETRSKLTLTTPSKNTQYVSNRQNPFSSFQERNSVETSAKCYVPSPKFSTSSEKYAQGRKFGSDCEYHILTKLPIFPSLNKLSPAKVCSKDETNATHKRQKSSSFSFFPVGVAKSCDKLSENIVYDTPSNFTKKYTHIQVPKNVSSCHMATFKITEGKEYSNMVIYNVPSQNPVTSESSFLNTHPKQCKNKIVNGNKMELPLQESETYQTPNKTKYKIPSSMTIISDPSNLISYPTTSKNDINNNEMKQNSLDYSILESHEEETIREVVAYDIPSKIMNIKLSSNAPPDG